MLARFCELFRQAISDAVARGMIDGLARGMASVTGEQFEVPPALTVEKPKRTAKGKR